MQPRKSETNGSDICVQHDDSKKNFICPQKSEFKISMVQIFVADFWKTVPRKPGQSFRERIYDAAAVVVFRFIS